MATWRPENSMLTKRGVEILNKLKAGVGSITVTRIVAGSGRVAESLLYQQTSISGVQKPMTISGKNTTDVGSEITFYIENKDFAEPYDLHQIGIYVTHPDYVGEQLYHISQCDANDYDTIPAISYTPVTQGYSVFMEHGNSSSVNITVDPSGMINTVQFNEFKESVNSLITDLTNGKAPAGFGLGESEGKTINALDDIDGFGFYRIPTESSIAPDTNSNWGAVFVGANINYGTLIASRAGGLIATRTKSGVWADRWEWVNPLMEIGVEYCTTERIKGKAVYKKNVNGAIQYRLDGETDWKPYANAVGASESQKYMFMVSSKESHTISTQGWYRVCSIDLSPDGYYDGTSFIMSISHAQSGSTAEALQVLVNCNKANPNIIVLGGGSDATLCYSKVRLTFDQTNTKFNFDIYWNANFQNQAQAPNFIVFLNGRHTHKSHEEIFTAMPLTLIDTLPSTESVIKEHIVKPIGSGNILTDESGVHKGLVNGVYNVYPVTDEVVDGILDSIILEMKIGTSRFVILNGQAGGHKYIFGGYNFVRIDKTADGTAVIQTSTYSPVTGGFQATRVKLNGVWYPWGENLHEGNGVKKSGDTMTGDLIISKATYPTIRLTETNNNKDCTMQFAGGMVDFTVVNVKDDGNNYRILRLQDSEYRKNVKNALSLLDIVKGVRHEYDILHTGNKPSGSYTGNGSSVERTIEVGGIGGCLVIYGYGGFALVTYQGTIVMNGIANKISLLYNSQCKYQNGVLTLATNDAVVNNNGATMYYQVL